MTIRRPRRALFILLAVQVTTPAAIAQGPPSAVFHSPKTSWGDPDLRGTWPGASVIMVPFERAPELGTRALLSKEEAAARDAQVDRELAAPLTSNYWPELARTPPLTSLIVDPANGRLPAATEDGARRAEQWRIKSDPNYPYAGPEDMRPYDRCITRGVLGSAFPNVYGSGMQIVQAPGVVVIRYEMIHEARIVLLDGRPHLSTAIQSYMGDPRGRWEGDTLVIETSNFNGKTGSYARNGDGNPTSTALKLVERFRLLDGDTLSYEVRIEDPQTWLRPWTVAFPLRRDERYVIHEYACHEGNYAMRTMLGAARTAEHAAR